MKCRECGAEMSKVDRRIEPIELDGNETEGQFADYIGAQESGDFSNWSFGIVSYYCAKCEKEVEMWDDNLKDFRGLIFSWHAKASQGDYFSRFVFEYLAFVAWLKNIAYIEAGGDRHHIQKLKLDKEWEERYLDLVEGNQLLMKVWKSLIKELKKEPLTNSSRDMDNPEVDDYWNNVGGKRNADRTKKMGVVHSTTDWINMVEFWNAVRNNLFHGGKDPDIQRDCFIVEHAYITLSAFMNTVVSKLEADGGPQIQWPSPFSGNSQEE